METLMIASKTSDLMAGLTALIGAMVIALAPAQAYEDVWPDLKSEIFGANTVISEDDGTIIMEAPYRAEDAAIVPIELRMPADVAPRVKKLTLIIDKNPAPIAAKITFGDAAGSGERKISTRIRLDMYSFVRAIVETDDGKLHMVSKFVKGAGGCSAPAMKDPDAALQNAGKMKLRSFAANQSTPQMLEAQVMVRHPNYSGMQMNQATGLFIPANFIQHMEVRRGENIVFKLEGGISLSEDPNIRFTYAGAGAGPLEVVATDSGGRAFTIRKDVAGS